MLDPAVKPIVFAFVFVLGLCIGSFLNVVGLRFLADEAITHPPSACPHCKTPIAPRDNIPVLSWLLLGGQCRSCKADISVLYPLMELSTGVLFVLTVWYAGISWQTLFLLFLICNLVVIFITDLKESLIFQINSLSLIPVGLLYNALNLSHGPVRHSIDFASVVIHVPDMLISGLIAMAIALVFFEGMILLSLIAFGTEGFGHGDTHLMMGAGAFLGWPLTVMALILGFIVQTIPAIPMLVIQWIKNKQWMSLISGFVAFAAGLSPMLIMNLPVTPDVRTALSLLAMVVSLVALVVFLKQVKTAQSFTYLPLGPALVIGILIALFFGDQVMAGYQHFLHQ